LGEALGDLKRTCCGDVGPEKIAGNHLDGLGESEKGPGRLVSSTCGPGRNRQVVFNPEYSKEAHTKASALRNEYV
jgi:hypothetical protein